MINIVNWEILNDVDEEYIQIRYKGFPGTISIKKEDDGFVIDSWTDMGVADMSIYSYFEDLNDRDE